MFSGLYCFYDDPAGVGNLVSGSFTFSTTSLNIWKFMVHVLLKPGLENFEHYFTSMWDECNCMGVWAFFRIAFLWSGMKTDLFQFCGHCWVFQICWHIECSTFMASSFRVCFFFFKKSLLNLLQYCFCFIFCFFGLQASGILVPQQGIEPAPPALEGEVLTPGPPGKSPSRCSFFLLWNRFRFT